MKTTVTEKFDSEGKLVERTTITEPESAPVSPVNVWPLQYPYVWYPAPSYEPPKITYTEPVITCGTNC